MKKRLVALLLVLSLILSLGVSMVFATDGDPLTDPDYTSAEEPVEESAFSSDGDAIYSYIMSLETAAEMIEALDALTEEEYALLSEVQLDAIVARINALDASAPVVTADYSDAPVESEIVFPTVNFSDVAPFLDPVEAPASSVAAASNFSLRSSAASTFAVTNYSSSNVSGSSGSGMELSKTAKDKGDGTYTITLEAYATGSKVISEVTEDIPTDIVLVLDQSGSMTQSMSSTSFEAYESTTTNETYYAARHNGGSENLWYLLEDGTYVSVSVQVTGSTESYTLYNGQTNETYFNNQSNLYYLDSNGNYYPVTISRSWQNGSWGSQGHYNYTYTANGINIATGYDEYSWGGTTSNFTPTNITSSFYQSSFDYTNATFTYTYTLSDAITTIETSNGGAGTCYTTFYQKVTSTTTRLQALKKAVTTFCDSVASKAAGANGVLGDDDDVNHRIAIVGFASGSSSSYSNTELFIGGTTYTYGTSGIDGQYTNAFQDMNTNSGVNNVSSSINMLDASGSTYIDLGLTIATNILDKNPVSSNEQRNRVVVIFTDGSPGYNGTWGSNGNNADADETADRALPIAKAIKDTGVTLYTVGIFDGADASTPASLPTYNNNNSEAANNANRFMHLLSSNYPEATSMTNTGSINPNLNGLSYYLSAADADTLNNIFQQISDQIESGGSSTTLSSATVIKDIISSQFTLPDGATADDITLETYTCTGKNGDAYTWTKNETAMGAIASVDGDQVSVTGFDFAENYVGTVTDTNGSVSYCGHKLVITITVVSKEGFLGGNNVPTNAGAGVYENSTATDPVITFPKPEINVPIGNVTVEAADKNVYLTEGLTTEDLLDGVNVAVGGTTLNILPDNVNYGLADWQTAYVNVTVTITDKDGNTIDDLTDLRDDTTYTVTVTVTPKTDGTGADGTPATTKTETDSAAVNVYKPELTYEDMTVYLGTTVNEATCNGQRKTLEWKHGSDEAPASMGTAPVLTFTYDVPSTALEDCTYVNVTVKIDDKDVTGNTTLVNANNDRNAFTIHVLKPSFTITAKDVWADADYDAVDLQTWGVGTPSVVWADANTGHTAGTPSGTKPWDTGSDYTLTFEKVGTSDGTLTNASFVTGVQDADFNVTNISYTFQGTTYTFPITVTKAVADEGHDFTVHINKFTLTINKDWGNTAATYKQSCIFNLKDSTGTIIAKVVIPNGESSVTVSGLLCGKSYSVEEEGAWSWRFAPGQNQTVEPHHHEPSNVAPAEAYHTNKTATITNTLNINKWLSGDYWVVNTFGKDPNKKGGN